MSQDWTNQHQTWYAIDDSSIQNPLLQKSYLLKKKENATRNKKSNFPSHIHKKKILTYAYNNADKLTRIDFSYVDIHGNLKFRLKNAISNKFVYTFGDKGELLNLFEKFGLDLDKFDGESEGGSTGGNGRQD